MYWLEKMNTQRHSKCLRHFDYWIFQLRIYLNCLWIKASAQFLCNHCLESQFDLKVVLKPCKLDCCVYGNYRKTSIKTRMNLHFNGATTFFAKKTVYLRKSQNTPMEVRRRYRSARHGKPVRWSRDSSVFRSKSHTLRGRRKLCRRVLGRNFHLDSHKNKHMW